MKIPTHRTDSAASTGYIIPIWSSIDQPTLRPDQVYVTASAPYSRKGPHLHLTRRGMLVCISGDVVIATAPVRPVYQKVEGPAGGVSFNADLVTGYSVIGPYTLHSSSATRDRHQQVLVDPGLACAIYNPEGKEAMVLNLPSPAWSKEKPDEWKVEGWEDPPIGRLLTCMDRPVGEHIIWRPGE